MEPIVQFSTKQIDPPTTMGHPRSKRCSFDCFQNKTVMLNANQIHEMNTMEAWNQTQQRLILIMTLLFWGLSGDTQPGINFYGNFFVVTRPVKGTIPMMFIF